MKNPLVATIACLIAVAPYAASAGVSLEGTIGSQRLGVDRTPGSSEPLSSMGDYGAALLLRSGALELGVAGQGTFAGGELTRFDASALAGFGVDVALVRLELLGELGFANLRSRADLEDAALGGDRWTRFHGVRPGLSAKLPLLPFRVGVWGLARWGLPGTSGAAYGLLGRLALDF